MNKNIAFFDFDGTMSKGDSLFVFLKFLVGKSKFYWGMISNFHYLLGYSLGLLSNTKAKQKVVSYFLKGMLERELTQKCQGFIPTLENIIKQSALQRMQWHLDRGDRVAIVSATFSCYLKPLAQRLGVDCLATELEVKEGILTGGFATPNCYGEEKVRRICEKYHLGQYQEIYAYGDSKGDREMLGIATQRFYRYFE